MDVVSLTRKLISFNTVNPPGNEKEISEFTGRLLSEHGFNVSFPVFEENRLHMVAEKGLSSQKPPIVLSGHFDTVPPGRRNWKRDPFAGGVEDGRIWGRGASDMKGGLASMIIASIETFKEDPPEGGVRIIFSAGEELGCLGISDLVRRNGLTGEACAIIVGEPTANKPITCHKGAIYLKAVATGKTAHSSMPELGINAIYKAARAVTRIMDLRFDAEKDPLLGYPTINVGMIKGGMNLNSIPDHAEFSIDIRTTPKVDHDEILEKITREICDEMEIEVLVNLKPLFTPETDPFVRVVYDSCGIDSKSEGYPKALPFLTDGAVLQSLYHGAPAVILGPGEPEMAHQTDEYCEIEALERSVSIYKNIILNRGSQSKCTNT